MSKRNELEILTDILKVSINGASKSHLVYLANLNFEVAERYLTCLCEANLMIFTTNDNPLFKTTRQGIEFLKQYEKLIGLTKNIQSICLFA